MDTRKIGRRKKLLVYLHHKKMSVMVQSFCYIIKKDVYKRQGYRLMHIFSFN